MAGPTLTASDAQYSPAADTSTLTSVTFSPANGDVLVVKATTWDTGTPMNTPTGGSQTYQAAQITAPGGFAGWSATWVCTVAGSPAPFAVSCAPTAGHSASRHSMVVEHWGSAFVDPTPAVLSPQSGSGATLVSSLTTTAANSVISWAIVDENSRDPATHTYTPSGTTQDGLYDGHVGSNSVQYFAYTAPIAAAGATALGLSVPAGTLSWVASGVEVKAKAGGAVVDLAATLTATGTLTAGLRREAPLAAALTATGTLSAAITRQVNLAAALTGTGALSVGLTREQQLAAGLTATGSLTAGLTRQVNLAAGFTATGSLTDGLTRETALAAGLTATGSLSAALSTGTTVDLAATLTATGSLSASLRREAPLAAGLTATGSMAVSLLDEAHLAAGLTATGSMSATLSAGPQTVTLSANLTATAGMTAVFSLPTIGPTDPIGTPVAEALMACFMEQLGTLPDPPRYVQIRVGSEGGPLIGPNIDECCAGLAWIRVANIYPSWDSFPAEDNTWTPCGPLAYAVVLEMGVSFCMGWSDSDDTMDNLDPPSQADWAAAFSTQMIHQTLMRRTAACCFPSTQRRAVGAWTPLPVEGGCTGGTLTVTVSVPAPCMDC